MTWLPCLKGVLQNCYCYGFKASQLPCLKEVSLEMRFESWWWCWWWAGWTDDAHANQDDDSSACVSLLRDVRRLLEDFAETMVLCRSLHQGPQPYPIGVLFLLLPCGCSCLSLKLPPPTSSSTAGIRTWEICSRCNKLTATNPEHLSLTNQQYPRMVGIFDAWKWGDMLRTSYSCFCWSYFLCCFVV